MRGHLLIVGGDPIMFEDRILVAEQSDLATKGVI